MKKILGIFNIQRYMNDVLWAMDDIYQAMKELQDNILKIDTKKNS